MTNFQDFARTFKSVLLQPIPVLEEGFVILLDMMPNIGHTSIRPEEQIVAAARVSTSRTYPALNYNYTDMKLFEYLFKSGHTSPFETVEFIFQVKAPMVVFSQWIRHRTASYNAYSGRYSYIEEPEFYVPKVWYRQSEKNKQGRSETAVIGDFSGRFETLIAESVKLYRDMHEAGVANEMARLVLPAYAMYTTFTYKANLLNVLRFLDLRVDLAAQFEIRQYALTILSIVQTLMPDLAACQNKYGILVPRKVKSNG